MSRSAESSRRPGKAAARGVAADVVPAGEDWIVRATDRPDAAVTYPTQAEAVAAAQAMMRAEGGRVAVLGRDGRVREGYTLGRRAFEKISAVEGIRIDARMRRDLREARERHACAEEARRALAAKYGAAAT